MTEFMLRPLRRAAINCLALSAGLIGGSMFIPNTALAETGDRIGESVTIVNTVLADLDRSQRQLSTGDDVRQDEVIEVTNNSQGEFKLDDDTKLALGPGSRLMLDKFVYDSDKKAGSIILNFAKGAFRFMTGVAAKPTYVINTPNASITVRGTIFDVFILPDETVWLLLHEGAVEVTGRNSPCRVLDQPGRLIMVSTDGVVGRPVDWSKLPGSSDTAFESAFPFVERPPQIDPQPVLTRAAVLNSAQPDVPDKPCLNTNNEPPVKLQKTNVDPGDGPAAPQQQPAQRAASRNYNPPVVVPKYRAKRVAVPRVYEKPKKVYAPKSYDKPNKYAKRPPYKDRGDKQAGSKAAGLIIGIGIGAVLGGAFSKGKGGYGGGGKHPKGY